MTSAALLVPILLTTLFLAVSGAQGPARAQEGQPVGAIRGVVYDKDFGVPLPGVQVRLVEAQREAVASDDGVFAFSQVAAGSYTLIFTKEGYERWVVPNVVVTPGRLTDVRADLASEVIEMEELVVTGVELMDDSEIAALEIRAEAITLQDAISSELISRAGVSDVGGALKLVVGASVVEGKYATVRGLSDRYTGTTLNGVRVPSADPRRRAVQVDLFPTGTVDRLTVTKSFTPDLHGDFTGGGVDIHTTSVPEEPILSVSVSQERNSEATGNEDFLTYEGGGSAPFGAGDQGHDIPSMALRRVFPNVPEATGNPTPQQMEDAVFYDRLVRSFDPVMGVETDSPGMNDGVSIEAGDSRDFGIGRTLGFIGALTWSHKYDFYEEGRNNEGVVSVAEDGLALVKERTESRGIDQVLLGVLGGVALRPDDDHEFKLQVIHNQSTNDETRFQEEDVPGPEVEQNQTLQYIERSVTSVQASGEHAYEKSGAHLDWVASRNYTEQNEPDVRFFRNRFNLANFQGFRPTGATDQQLTRRYWREGEETNYQGSMNVGTPFRQWSDLEGSFKAGFYVESTDRVFTQHHFYYSWTLQAGSLFDPRVAANRAKDAFNGKNRDDLWTNVFLNPDRIGLARNDPPAPNQLLWVIQPFKQTDINYDGFQEIDAAYAMAELPLFPRLKTLFGARFERTDLSIFPVNETFGLFDTVVISDGDRVVVRVPQDQANTEIRDETVLPSVTLICEILPSMSLRAGWSRTLARPTFRELAPVATQEFAAGEEFIGNPDLTLSSITNYDLRWEWFPRPGEVLAASVFHKEIEKPIELISFLTGSGSFISPVNYHYGELSGVEVEARSSLDVFGESLKGFSAGINYTWLDSEVEVPEEEQAVLAPFGLDEETRQLQGQPDYILNVNVTYDNERTGTSAGAFYNLTGEVLLTGAAKGTDSTPNVFELPAGNLDLTLSQKVRGAWSVSFKATNVLGDDRTTIYRTPSGQEAVKTQRELASRYTLSAKWSF